MRIYHLKDLSRHRNSTTKRTGIIVIRFFDIVCFPPVLNYQWMMCHMKDRWVGLFSHSDYQGHTCKWRGGGEADLRDFKVQRSLCRGPMATVLRRGPINPMFVWRSYWCNVCVEVLKAFVLSVLWLCKSSSSPVIL